MGRMISLTEYAERNGRSPVTVRQKAQRRMLKTAVKVGKMWMIDEDEPLIDNRCRNTDDEWQVKGMTITITPEGASVKTAGDLTEEDLKLAMDAVRFTAETIKKRSLEQPK